MINLDNVPDTTPNRERFAIHKDAIQELQEIVERLDSERREPVPKPPPQKPYTPPTPEAPVYNPTKEMYRLVDEKGGTRFISKSKLNPTPNDEPQ